MTTTGARKSGRLGLDRAVVVVAFMLLGALALSSPLLTAINGMRFTGCRSRCDISLVGVGGAVIMAGCIGVTVVACTVLLVPPRPGRSFWWLTCSALAIAGTILLIGNHLIDLGSGA